MNALTAGTKVGADRRSRITAVNSSRICEAWSRTPICVTRSTARRPVPPERVVPAEDAGRESDIAPLRRLDEASGGGSKTSEEGRECLEGSLVVNVPSRTLHYAGEQGQKKVEKDGKKEDEG